MGDNRYNHGKIYRLVNSVDGEFYVGSTCGMLAKRLYKHKNDAKKQITRPVYAHLNDIGWEHVSIVLVEEYPCENKMELERKEREMIEQLKPGLNKNIPTRTKQERATRYRAENADKVRESKAKYYAENADKVCEKQAKYRAENADKVRESKAKYRTENADKVRETLAKWRAENADKVREYQAKYREQRALKKLQANQSS